MKKVIYLYVCTILVCFFFSSIYMFLETRYSDEVFDQKPMLEKQFYVKYCTDDLSFNPFDSYMSKLETYLVYLCFLVGMWNFADLIIIVEKDNKGKPEDRLLYDAFNDPTYKNIVRKIRKIRKRKSNAKKNTKRK